ncbi:hypothetical protein [Hamadaea tsunoensis]|uniref:hypothetical protein n=1 Tax=Hamadaea tsunoensis TaxID=53368 RepID=UPI00041713D7|nr:hypothetical protein [Hamadaea tsunoensis]
MPGWYVHMQAAQDVTERLRAGSIPANLPVTAVEAQDLGEICHRWRNYLAIGSLGPDLFYMLPDFANTRGCVIRQVVQWVLDVWAEVDAEFVAKWERWVTPTSTNSAQLASQLTGGLSSQLGQILTELSSAITSAFEGLLVEMGDWFGVLTSGPPQGFSEDAFYWADIFHYRRTYQFAFVLYQQAAQAYAAAASDGDRSDAEARMAFAVGWMTHCGTDVTGHPFTNAKSGGPYRDHWQRHHLVEAHIDSQNYVARYSGPCYGEPGTSALHFRVAFRRRPDAPYSGRDDGPAYDYFTGFPAYDTSDGPTPAAERQALFDLDSGGLPEHLTDALLAAMALVHPDGPKILTQDPQYSGTDPAGTPDGRPNADAMAQMWDIVYAYLKLSSRDGLSPRRPQPPDVFTDHSFPTPPGGGGYGVDDDPARGADVDDDDSFSLLDLLLAILAWAVYIAEVVVWLVTVLPGLILDVFTFPAREVFYYVFVVPAWNLYMLARRALVMSGFLVPKPEETDPGLTVLGTASGVFSVGSALDDPAGAGSPQNTITEPSGRQTSTSAFGLDLAYPRNVVRDHPADVHDVDLTEALGLTAPLRYAGDAGKEFKASEWLSPWRYPLRNQAGAFVAQEGAATHVGPYVAGQDSTVLLSTMAGDGAARYRLEKAASAQETFNELQQLLPQNLHLGAPVDYGTYLVSRMLAEKDDAEFGVPDFNLDADRGYAWHCWDWQRHNLGRDPANPGRRGVWECGPSLDPTPQAAFIYAQPCTPPHFFHADTDNPAQSAGGVVLDSQFYDPRRDLKVRYLKRAVAPPPERFGEDPCGPAEPPHRPVDGGEWPHSTFEGER